MKYEANSFIENHKNSFVREPHGSRILQHFCAMYSIIRIVWLLMRILYRQENEGITINWPKYWVCTTYVFAFNGCFLLPRSSCLKLLSNAYGLAYPSFKEANGDFMMLDYHAASRLIKATNNTVDNFYHNSETDEMGNHDLTDLFLFFATSQYFRPNKSCLLIKVRTLWEGHKIWKNIAHGFDVY